jgi:hypothetical protein
MPPLRCVRPGRLRTGATAGQWEESALSGSARPQSAPGNLLGALLGVVVVALFVAGLAAGGLAHSSRSGSTLTVANARSAAFLGPPATGPIVTPVLAEPTTTVSTAPPADPAPPRPADRPSRSAVSVPAPTATVESKEAAALARVSYPWQQLGYRIVFLGPQAGVWGRTSPRSMGFIDIYVRPDESVDMLAHVIAHEIGHAVDLTYGNDQRRQVWEELRGVSPRPWFTCSMCEDFSTPAGDFAETFAYWQLHDFSRSELAPAPTAAQLAQLTPLFQP